MAKPMSKSRLVSHMLDKIGTPESRAIFENVFKLAVKEAKGGAGKFVIPNIGRAVKAHRKARMGRNPTDWRSDQDQGKDSCASPRGKSVQKTHFCS